jgi:cytochrome P450
MTIIQNHKQRLPPGPAGFSRVRAIQHIRRSPLVAMQNLTQTYGDIVHIGLGPYRIYLLNHPDYLHEMLVRQASIMRKPRTLSRPIADFLGNGLLISEGDYWLQQRRVVQPAFYPRRTPDYAHTMVDCIISELATWQTSSIHDVDHEFMKMTLRMVTGALFSTKIDGAIDDVAEAVKTLQHISYNQGQAAVPVPTWVPLPAHLAKQRAMRLLNQLVIQIMREGQAGSAAENDLMAMLLQSTGEQGQHLTEQQIRDEVMTVLLAGHESTANAITWMCWLLAQHPAAVQHLRAEMDRVLCGRLPTADDLKSLPYNAMVVKEALRLYPPAWALPREAAEDTEIGGYSVRKGSLLLGVPFLIQRDPRYYQQPDMFIPERFANNAERRLPQHVYLPFGGGPRFCVGSTFALLAMQLTLAVVYQRFDLQLADDPPVTLDPLLTLRPRFGVHMHIKALTNGH